RQQSAVAEWSAAVPGAEGSLLLTDVERRQPRTEHHLRRARVEMAMVLDQLCPAGLREILFEVLQQIDTAAEALVADAARQLDIARHLRRIADHERRIAHAEEARTDGREAAADADEGRQVE